MRTPGNSVLRGKVERAIRRSRELRSQFRKLRDQHQKLHKDARLLGQFFRA